MPSLAFPEQQRARHHLGYTNRAVPAGDELILNRSLLDDTKTFEWVQFALKLLNRCDKTFDESETDQQDSGIAYRRVLTGDRNYTDVEYRALTQSQREKAYIRETDRLARFLGARNYNNPENWQYLNYGSIRQ
jgi:hypothetical protein